MARMTGYAGQAFDTAGRGAALDTWKVAPPFAAMIGISKSFGFLAPCYRGVAAMIALISPDNSYVTGQALAVDGGISAF